MKRLMCVRDHRMVEIVPNLYLCECSSYGPAASLKGAVEDARAMVERAGGIANIRDALERAEAERKAQRDQARRKQSAIQRGAIRQG